MQKLLKESINHKNIKMKNYKIIENRPELTNQQIAEGINFNKIKNGATVAQKVILKSLITKGLVGIVIVISSVLVYKNYNHKPISPKEQLAMLDTISKHDMAKDSVISEPINTRENSTIQTSKTENKIISTPVVSIKKSEIDSSQKIISSVKNSNTTEAVQLPTSNTKINERVDTFKNNKIVHAKFTQTFKASGYASAKIWKTKSYCDLPKPAFDLRIDMTECDFDTISCYETAHKTNLVGVWITVILNKKTKFNLETQFKNVSLIKNLDGSSVHPSILGFDGFSFMKNLKAESFVAHVKNKLNIFVFFPEAKVGDKIIIDNFIQTEIK